MTRAFLYIIGGHTGKFELTGSVPHKVDQLIVFGACKNPMKAKVQVGDYIIGISNSIGGSPRKVIFCMRVKEIITFQEAWRCGEKDALFRKLRGGRKNPLGPIHVRPIGKRANGTAKYKHIPGAVHKNCWKKDVKCDRFFIGDKTSKYFGGDGPLITKNVIKVYKHRYCTDATVKNPCGRYPRGQYWMLDNSDAMKFLKAIKFRTARPGDFVLGERFRKKSRLRKRC